MELKLIDAKGESTSNVTAPDTVFGRDYNEALIHQLVTAYQANARSGNRAQKGRSDIAKSIGLVCGDELMDQRFVVVAAEHRIGRRDVGG